MDAFAHSCGKPGSLECGGSPGERPPRKPSRSTEKVSVFRLNSCSGRLAARSGEFRGGRLRERASNRHETTEQLAGKGAQNKCDDARCGGLPGALGRSEEHTSELQS